LRSRGVLVIVPVVDAEFTALRRLGDLAQLHTAADLREAATDTVELEALLGAALRAGYPLRYPFVSPVTQEPSTAEPAAGAARARSPAGVGGKRMAS
jgi:hypothetical protein